MSDQRPSDFHGKPITSLADRFHELSNRDVTSRAIATLKAKGAHDPARHPDPAGYPPLTIAEHLEVLALGEHLARYYRHPANVHDAVRAGASWPQIAAALDIPETRARAAYRQWADSQHHLWETTDRQLGLDDAEHAAAIQHVGPVPDIRTIAFNLMAGDDYFVLTEALREWAARERDMAANDPDTADSRHQWATAADRMLDRIEAALDRKETRR